MKKKFIVLLIILTIIVTGCGCSKKKEVTENKNITDITIEIPMSEVETIEIKTGQNEYATVKKDKSFDIITWITPKEKKNTSLKWKVSNPNIITINEYGKVTAKKVGKTSITAYTIVEENKVTSNTIDIEVIE